MQTESSDIQERWAFGLALAVITGAALLARTGGLNPDVLWMDDLWVAALAKLHSPVQAFMTPAPVPQGFVLLLWTLEKWFQDPEWPLQLLPFIASLAVIPVTGLAVRRLTESRAAGVLAAAFMATDVWVAAYSVNVKPYATDALIVSLMLFFWLPYLTRPVSIRSLATFMGLSLLALFFSFYSVFVACALLVHMSVHYLLDARQARRAALAKIAGVWAIGAVCLSLFYKVWIHGRSSPALEAYFDGYFLEPVSLDAVGAFLSGPALGVLTDAMPYWQAGWAVFFMLGVVILAVSPRGRGLLLPLAVLFVGLALASALRLLPVGVCRLTVFLHPVLILVTVAGMAGLTELLPSPRLGTLTLRAAALLALWTAVSHPVRPNYPEAAEPDALAAVLESVEKGALLSPASQWLVAYYGPWSYTPVAHPGSITSHSLRFEGGRPEVLPVDGGPAAVLPPVLWARTHPARLQVVATRFMPLESTESFLARAGYDVQARTSDPDAQVLTFLR